MECIFCQIANGKAEAHEITNGCPRALILRIKAIIDRHAGWLQSVYYHHLSLS